MLFYTPEFGVFSLALLALLAVFRRDEPRKLILLLASYVFYMWWNPAFIALIVFATAVNYLAGVAIARARSERARKLSLVASLVASLGLLAYFKYAGFFLANALPFLGALGLEPSWAAIQITLPVGISFYTFQTLSYTLDVYRRQIEAVHSPLDFALFVAFFPQLVAGPIVRASEFLPQLQARIRLACDQRSYFLILRGLAKKVFIADNLALLPDGVFSNPEAFPSLIIWIAAVAFAIQIYCDFSGYTDMAIGIARILGFDIPKNFDHPYLARNPSDFWRRWHISLSSWLRDYLYISLGGNRGSTARTYRNLMLTMVLGGLWHGASWNFVIWGCIHGAMLVIHRGYQDWRRSRDAAYASSNGIIARWSSILALQYCVLMAWITFRVTDFEDMKIALSKFVFIDFDFALANLGLGRLTFFGSLVLIGLFLLLHGLSYRLGDVDRYLARVGLLPACVVSALFGFVAVLLWPLSDAPFIYFQF